MGPKSHRVIAAAVLASALGIAASAAAVTVHIDQNTLVELRAPACASISHAAILADQP